jgi:hypothetical protein
MADEGWDEDSFQEWAAEAHSPEKLVHQLAFATCLLVGVKPATPYLEKRIVTWHWKQAAQAVSVGQVSPRDGFAVCLPFLLNVLTTKMEIARVTRLMTFVAVLADMEPCGCGVVAKVVGLCWYGPTSRNPIRLARDPNDSSRHKSGDCTSQRVSLTRGYDGDERRAAWSGIQLDASSSQWQPAAEGRASAWKRLLCT